MSLALGHSGMRWSDRALLGELVLLIRRAEAGEDLPDALLELPGARAEDVVLLLRRHRLMGLWWGAVTDRGRARRVPDAVAEACAEHCERWVARRLGQEAAVPAIARELDRCGIRHVFFKGAHLAELLYPKPWQRGGCDIDVLVDEANRAPALSALARLGFRCRVAAGLASHEVRLTRPGAVVDLHWELLRPGRSREPLAASVLGDRVRSPRSGTWVPSPAWTLFVMLVHSAVTEQVTSRVVRAIDLDRWVRTQPCPWDELSEHLARSGLRTAGWLSLCWASEWFETPVPAEVEVRSSPGSIRRRYLRAWLRSDPAGLYRRRPGFVRAAFNLALHDGLGDALRSVCTTLEWRLRRAATARRIEGEIARCGA